MSRLENTLLTETAMLTQIGTLLNYIEKLDLHPIFYNARRKDKRKNIGLEGFFKRTLKNHKGLKKLIEKNKHQTYFQKILLLQKTIKNNEARLIVLENIMLGFTSLTTMALFHTVSEIYNFENEYECFSFCISEVCKQISWYGESDKENAEKVIMHFHKNPSVKTIDDLIANQLAVFICRQLVTKMVFDFDYVQPDNLLSMEEKMIS